VDGNETASAPEVNRGAGPVRWRTREVRHHDNLRWAGIGGRARSNTVNAVASAGACTEVAAGVGVTAGAMGIAVCRAAGIVVVGQDRVQHVVGRRIDVDEVMAVWTVGKTVGRSSQPDAAVGGQL